MIGGAICIPMAFLYYFCCLFISSPQERLIYTPGILIGLILYATAVRPHWMTYSRIIRSLTGLFVMFCCSVYVVQFPNWYTNGIIPLIFSVYPPVAVVMVAPMASQYYNLLSRNVTEKEAQSRQQYTSTQPSMIDPVLDPPVPLATALKNIFKKFMEKRPASLVTIGRHIEQHEKARGREGNDPEELARLEHEESSTSSSSEDEIPAFFIEQFKKRQAEID